MFNPHFVFYLFVLFMSFSGYSCRKNDLGCHQTLFPASHTTKAEWRSLSLSYFSDSISEFSSGFRIDKMPQTF